jgi:SAM-dependent methyltransferase
VSHLDIGCSTGILLEKFGREFGFKTTGVEPGEAYRAYGRSRGLEIFASLDKVQPHQDIRFDLISLIHVLEHLAEPVAYLENLREHFLSPDGYLLLEVPNLYAHNSFEVAHLIAYSKHTLCETLRKAGFKIVSIQSHGNPRSKLLPLYITAVAKPVQEVFHSYNVKPERSVDRKRQFGMLKRHLFERFASRWAWLPLPESS